MRDNVYRFVQHHLFKPLALATVLLVFAICLGIYWYSGMSRYLAQDPEDRMAGALHANMDSAAVKKIVGVSCESFNRADRIFTYSRSKNTKVLVIWVTNWSSGKAISRWALFKTRNPMPVNKAESGEDPTATRCLDLDPCKLAWTFDENGVHPSK